MITLPPPYINVMITYKKTFYSGVYREKQEVHEVTRMGFYSDLFDNWSIPDEWQNFRIGGVLCLLPYGFNRDKLTTDQVINWKPC